jgi:membrane protein required for colicin V production
MNWLDLVILLALAWFVIAGATAGLPRELLTLVAMLLGVVLAGLFHDRLGMDFDLFTENENLARVLAFLAIFGAVYGAGQIAAVMLKGFALTLTFGPLDHTGGLVLGLVKGIVLIETLLFLFVRYHFEPLVAAIDGSFLAPFFLRGIGFLVLPLLPGDFREAVDAFPAPI